MKKTQGISMYDRVYALINHHGSMTMELLEKTLATVSTSKGQAAKAVSSLVTDKKLKRATRTDGTVLVYHPRITVPSDYIDRGYNLFRTAGRTKAPPAPPPPDDDFLILIKWKENETLTLTVVEAEDLHRKLSRALRKEI